MELFSFVFVMLIIWGCMWLFFKFMYPKPPKAFMPKQGDVITPRDCDYCGYPLAEYRGILETKPNVPNFEENGSEENKTGNSDRAWDEGVNNKEVTADNHDNGRRLTRRERKQQALLKQQQEKEAYESKRAHKLANTWFFCNAEHQAKFHAGETYDRK